MVSLECMDQEHLPPQQDGSLEAAVVVVKEHQIAQHMVVVALDQVILDTLVAEMVAEVLEDQEQMFQGTPETDMLEPVVEEVDTIQVHMDQEAVVQVLW